MCLERWGHNRSIMEGHDGTQACVPALHPTKYPSEGDFEINLKNAGIWHDTIELCRANHIQVADLYEHRLILGDMVGWKEPRDFTVWTVDMMEEAVKAVAAVVVVNDPESPGESVPDLRYEYTRCIELYMMPWWRQHDSQSDRHLDYTEAACTGCCTGMPCWPKMECLPFMSDQYGIYPKTMAPFVIPVRIEDPATALDIESLKEIHWSKGPCACPKCGTRGFVDHISAKARSDGIEDKIPGWDPR